MLQPVCEIEQLSGPHVPSTVHSPSTFTHAAPPPLLVPPTLVPPLAVAPLLLLDPPPLLEDDVPGFPVPTTFELHATSARAPAKMGKEKRGMPMK